jgi:hypothetical protein
MSRLSTAVERLGLELVKVFNDGDVEDAKETIRECLMASRTVRAGRDEGGHIIYREVPDYPIRLAAGIKIIEWSIGKPVSRSIVANTVQEEAKKAQAGGDDLLNLLLAAPEEAAAIVAKLQEAAKKAKNAQPVEITVTPTPPEGEKPSS